MGPPFLNPMYAPGRTPDQAFFEAVANGVKQRNWKFGSMPAIPSLSKGQVANIVTYVRAEQQKAGIS